MSPENSPTATCPDDETLVALIEHRVVGDRLARLERHVATCPTCLDVVAATLPPVTGIRSPDEQIERLVRNVPTLTRGPHAIRLHRWAMAAGVLLAVGGLLLGATRWPIGEHVATTLARLGTKLLGAQLAAKTVDVRFADEPSTLVVTLYQVGIGDASERLVSADAIAVTVALAAPLSGEPVITGVRVTHPELSLVARDSATLVSSKADRAQVLALLARASRIDVVDGRVLLPGPGGTSLAVEALTGGVERTADGARLALQGRTAGGAVDVMGTIAGAEHDIEATIGGRGLDATALPILGARLSGIVDLHLDLTTRANVLRVDGRVAARKGHLVGRGPVALLRLSVPVRDILAGFDPALVGDDLPFDDARAIVVWHHGTWRFPRIFVTTRDVIAGGRASISARGEVSGHGTLRLPPELAGALQPEAPLLTGFRDESGAATVPFTVGGSWQVPQLVLDRP